MGVCALFLWGGMVQMMAACIWSIIKNLVCIFL